MSRPKEIPFIFKPAEILTYPGYKGGNHVTQNLCAYKEDVRMWDETAFRDAQLEFNIQRNVSWDSSYNLNPHKYSVSIRGSYPTARSIPLIGKRPTLPTRVATEAVMASLKGFVQAEDSLSYVSPGENLRISRIPHPDSHRVSLIVSQEKPIEDLSAVMDNITPLAVELFNELSPTKKISPQVLDQVMLSAWDASMITPQCRIPASKR